MVSRIVPPTWSLASSQAPTLLSQRSITSSSGRCGERGQRATLDPELAAPDLPLVLEEAARRRPGRAPAVVVVDPAVAGAHEEPGFREPADWAAEVGAVYREHLEAIIGHPPHVTRHHRGRTVPCLVAGIGERGQPGFADGKLAQRSDPNP